MIDLRPSPLNPYCLTVLALCLDVAFPAYAADTEPVPQPRVEVRGSVEQYDARREDTSTRSVVTQEELKKYGDSRPALVLNSPKRSTPDSTANCTNSRATLGSLSDVVIRASACSVSSR